MRDEKRIERILKILEEIWKENPNQRFGQLLINLGIINDNLITWKNEDDLLEKSLIKLREDENKI